MNCVKTLYILMCEQFYNKFQEQLNRSRNFPGGGGVPLYKTEQNKWTRAPIFSLKSASKTGDGPAESDILMIVL